MSDHRETNEEGRAAYEQNKHLLPVSTTQEVGVDVDDSGDEAFDADELLKICVYYYL